MALDPILLVYLVPLLALWAWWVFKSRRHTSHAVAVLEDNRRAGLIEPQSLHPVIDPAICLGCKSCVIACPEKTVLGIIDGKAALIEPTLCVGHGACQSACPTGAITLVFGSETRGVDIPMLTPEFETNVPGVFIAGELGGMGLIKNAIEQGRQAIDHIAARARKIAGAAGVRDVVIVGCGPAGISASLGAIQHKLDFVILDQSTLGGTVAHFPRGKLVMTAPATLPLVGEVKFGEISKEKLLGFWEEVIERTGLEPVFEEQVLEVRQDGSLFEVVTTKRTHRTKSVLLAIGRRGTPRPLGVPGEELDKVYYRLIDPEQFAGRKVLVVGGGDSALEAASRIAEQPGAEVTLSYRGQAYSRARAKNRDAVARMVGAGKIEEMLESKVTLIGPDFVELEWRGSPHRIANEAVIICAGGLLPTKFLADMGVKFETKFGTA